jgi:hypothetical protein
VDHPYPEAVPAQDRRQRRADPHVVLDDEQAHGAPFPRFHPAQPMANRSGQPYRRRRIAAACECQCPNQLK